MIISVQPRFGPRKVLFTKKALDNLFPMTTRAL